MPVSKPVAHQRSKVAALERWPKPDNTELTEARRDLAAIRIAEFIKRTVDAAPPLTSQQRTELAELLKPVRIQRKPAKRTTKRGRAK